MTSSSFDGGDWEVLDLDANPTPGDPEAISSAASGLLNEAQLAQERASRLQSVADSSGDLAMQGGYAPQFQQVLSSLPGPPGDLAESYQSSATALSSFADALAQAQAQSSAALERGTQADAMYRSALADFGSYVEVPEGPGGVWRGLNQGSAQELALPLAEQYAAEAGAENPAAYQEEYENVMSWAAQVGQYAGLAEEDRQAAIQMALAAAQQRTEAEQQCAQTIQEATPEPLSVGSAGDSAVPAGVPGEDSGTGGGGSGTGGGGGPGGVGGGEPGWPKLSTTPLFNNPQFKDESIPGKSKWRDWRGNELVVDYLNAEQREPFRVTVREGKLYDADGNLLDTLEASSAHENGEGRGIWVMDEDGNLYVSLRQEVGRFHHSSFLSGGEVAGAGEIRIENGEVTLINDHSGHYRPDRIYTRQAIARLRALGVKAPRDENDWWALDDGLGYHG